MKGRCLLAIWLDGFRTDYIDEQTTPFLYNLSKKSLVGEYQPLFAFTGIGVSMLTGLSPIKHGVWVEFFYDPSNSPFKWASGFACLGSKIDAFTDRIRGGRLFRMGLNFLTFKVSRIVSKRTYMPMALLAPSSNLRFFNTLPHDIFKKKSLTEPTLFDLLDEKGIPFRILSESVMKDNEVFNEAMHVDLNARLLFMQLGETDTVGHSYGPNSKELKQSLRTIDDRVHKIVDEYIQRFETDVLVFSDHGMVAVDNTVNILQQLRLLGLKEGRDFVSFLDSTLARFWGLKPNVKEKLLTGLLAIPHGTVLTDDLLEQYNVPKDRKYGDIIWLAKPGSIILPNHYQGSKMAYGMHGYIPEANGNRAPFILYSKNIEPRSVKYVANPMDIFATIAVLLNLDVPWSIDGIPLTSVS